MSDIEQRLREADERLAMEIAVEMELHAAISTTTKAKAEAIAKFLAPAFASLRSKLEEAEGALEPFAFGDSDIADILWGNLPDDASMKTTAPLGAYRRARRTLASLREADHA